MIEDWYTIQGQQQRVTIEDRFGVRTRVRHFIQFAVLGYIPLRNYEWDMYEWVDITHMGMPGDDRVFLQGRSR